MNAERVRDRKRSRSRAAAIGLTVLLGVFAALPAFVPLRTAVQIGADEVDPGGVAHVAVVVG